MDATGNEIVNDLSAIFGRQQEETVQTVSNDDVAEVLRLAKSLH
jgi:LmbE family N-acetylglucosaminyl deacetylase